MSKRHATRQSPHRLMVLLLCTPTASVMQLLLDPCFFSCPRWGTTSCRFASVQNPQVVYRRLSLCQSGRISLGRSLVLTGAGALQAEFGTRYSPTPTPSRVLVLLPRWGLSRPKMQKNRITVRYSRSGLLHNDPFIISHISCGPLFVSA